MSGDNFDQKWTLIKNTWLSETAEAVRTCEQDWKPKVPSLKKHIFLQDTLIALLSENVGNYDKMFECITAQYEEHIKKCAIPTIQSAIDKGDDRAALNVLCEQWFAYSNLSTWISVKLPYLNRMKTWLSQRPQSEMQAITVFKKLVWKKFGATMFPMAANIVWQVRQGESIKICFHGLFTVMEENDTKDPYGLLEIPSWAVFLNNDCKCYFQQVSDAIAKRGNVWEFVLEAEKIRALEKAHVGHVTNFSKLVLTEAPQMQLYLVHFLQRNFEKVFENKDHGLRQLFKTVTPDQMRRLCETFEHIDEAMVAIGNLIVEVATTELTETLEFHKNKLIAARSSSGDKKQLPYLKITDWSYEEAQEFIADITTCHKKRKYLMEADFHGKKEVLRKLNIALGKAIGQPISGLSCDEVLLIFVQSLISAEEKGLEKDNQMKDKLLEDFVRFLTMYEGRELFWELYRTDLSHRLFPSLSSPTNVDIQLIKIADEHVGLNFVRGIQKMMDDIKGHAEMQKEFQDWQGLENQHPARKNKNAKKGGSGQGYKQDEGILTTFVQGLSHWPAERELRGKIPHALSEYEAQFLKHYKEKYPSRRIEWLDSLASVVVESALFCEGKPYTRVALHLTVHQYYALNYLLQKKTATQGEVISELLSKEGTRKQLEPMRNNFKMALHSLATADFPLLIWKAQGGKDGEQDNFRLNEGYSAPTQVLKIPPPKARGVIEVTETEPVLRMELVAHHIVKYVKKKQRNITFSELLQYSAEQVKPQFELDNNMFKKALKYSINNQFCVEKEGDKYKYT